MPAFWLVSFKQYLAAPAAKYLKKYVGLVTLAVQTLNMIKSAASAASPEGSQAVIKSAASAPSPAAKKSKKTHSLKIVFLDPLKRNQA